MEIEDILQILSQESNLPYYLNTEISKIYKGEEEISLISRGEFINLILSSSSAKTMLLNLNKINCINMFLPRFNELIGVPQKKHKSTNVLMHTMNVLEKVPVEDMVFRWAALLHDFGKIISYKKCKNFKRHELYSGKYTADLTRKYRILGDRRIFSIVLWHMRPLAYQRNPNWKDDTIIKFIEDVGEKYALDIIQFSIYDKLAETSREDFIKPLYELKEKVKEMINGTK